MSAACAIRTVASIRRVCHANPSSSRPGYHGKTSGTGPAYDAAACTNHGETACLARGCCQFVGVSHGFEWTCTRNGHPAPGIGAMGRCGWNVDWGGVSAGVSRPAVTLPGYRPPAWMRRSVHAARPADRTPSRLGTALCRMGIRRIARGQLGPLCTLKDRPIHPWRERTLDAYAALEYLAARADVDRANIFVMGWSHGGSTVTGVVREKAQGQRVDGPGFRAAIAYYPGCERPLRVQHYRLTIPLLIQHGAADDWAPAAPCVELAAKLQRLGVPVETILYPEAHHGFEAPNSPLRFRPDVYNPRAPGERGAHVGTHEPARLQAIADTKRFLDQQLAR